MAGRAQQVRGVRVPTLLYGTAWKQQRTAPVAEQALGMGFRGVDTANQRRHHLEAEVGRVADDLAAYEFTLTPAEMNALDHAET